MTKAKLRRAAKVNPDGIRRLAKALGLNVEGMHPRLIAHEIIKFLRIGK